MILAVDTGGTKTLVARFENGEPRQIMRFPTPKDISEYVQRVSDQIHLIAQGEPVTHLSIAVPGVVRDGVAIWCKNLDWRNVPVQQLFVDLFPNASVIVANDANLAGLASMRRLEKIPRCGLYITIGTGIGTSLLLDGVLEPALSDCEGGHMMVTYNNRQQPWEQIASGRALHNLFGTISAQAPLEVWSNIAERIGVGLQPLVAFVQPDVVVIGGSIGAFTSYFADTLSGLLAEKLPAAISVPKIIGAPQPEEIVLYGCYDNALAQHQHN